MPFLDMRTIVFGNVIIDIICLLVILFLWRQSRKRFGGGGFWVFDFAFQTAAVILIVLRGSIPDWMSMVLANTLIVGGTILGYMGLGRFVGKRIPQVHNYILLAAFAGVHAYFTLVQPDLAARTLNVSLGLLIIGFQCLWLMVYGVNPGTRPLTLGVGLVFGGYCLVSLVRIVEILAGSFTATDLFKPGHFDSLILVSYQILFILLTYNLVLMVNKRLVREVTLQEEKFAKAFRSSPYALSLTRLTDGQIIEVNNGFSNISGYRQEEIIGKTTVDLHLWEKDEDRAAVVDELSKKGTVQEREFQFRKKSGEILTGLFSAEIIPIDNQIFVPSSINDITARKRTEETLSRAYALRDLLLKQAPTGLAFFDRELRYWLINERLAEINGIPAAEHIGKSVREIMPSLLPTVQKVVDRILETGQPVENHEFCGETALAPGVNRYWNESWYPVHDQTGAVLGFGMIVEEITERKQVEEALKKAHDELEVRVRERTQELSEAAEKIRIENIQRQELENTLRESENRVRFFASQYLRAQEDERKRIAGDLHDSVIASLSAVKIGIEKTADELIRGNCGPESLRQIPEKVNEINNEIRRIMADLRPAILDDLGITAAMNWFCREYEKTYSHISVEKEIGLAEDEVPDSLKTPVFRITQEAMNNIAKYSRASLVNLFFQRKDNKIILAIADNGQGFDLTTIKRGLGLSTMRERAQLSGGAFGLETALGRGTVVRVEWNV